MNKRRGKKIDRELNLYVFNKLTSQLALCNIYTPIPSYKILRFSNGNE